MATYTTWLIYLLIFALGFIVGRIVTTIQIGLKYQSHMNKLKGIENITGEKKAKKLRKK